MTGKNDWDIAVESMKKVDEQRSKNGRWTCGCIVAFIVLTIGAIFGISILGGIWGENTWVVPGDPAKFDPLASFGEVQKFAGENLIFISLEARYIKSDGTVDLYADYNPRVEYTFAKLSDAPENNVPPGAPGYSADGQKYDLITVELSRPFQMWSVTTNGSTSSYINLGMDRDVREASFSEIPEETVLPPACAFTELWQLARSYDAPTNGVAIIEYDEDGYDFRINGTGVDLEIDHDCVVIRS